MSVEHEADTLQLQSVETVPTRSTSHGEIVATPTSSETEMNDLCYTTTTTPSQSKVCEFFLKGKCKFGSRCHNLHPHSESCLSKQKKSHSTTSTDRSAKKPAMKTATNVLHRILWDSHLPSETFVVGYLDRFIGIVELPFESFNGLDTPSLLGHKVLAIPKHRIQYFKYKGVIVWDKASQVDNVFGSRGTGKTITDVMREVDGEAVGELEVGEEEEAEDECELDPEDVEAVERVEESRRQVQLERDGLQVDCRFMPVPVA